MQNQTQRLFQPLTLPCGVTLKNRIIKAAMSDSLGDGRGAPSPAQIRLYARWAAGGLAAAIVGEVQGDPKFAEKPGNLVLRHDADPAPFTALTQAGALDGAQLWAQLGHAGAMTHPPISTPRGPSALDLPGLTCDAMPLDEVKALPAAFAHTAVLAQSLGFGGVEVHAAHGFLLSQFLSPLFNKRTDIYGGDLSGRMRLVLEVVDAVRAAVGPRFPVAIKLNATDQLSGGFTQDEALSMVEALDQTAIDLIDISGGTYFPGAKSASDSGGSGPYFADFTRRARTVTTKPLMLTGGIKTYDQACAVLASGDADVVGLARTLVLDPDLPQHWACTPPVNPTFPRFTDPPEGGITAWYSIRLTEIGEDRETPNGPPLPEAIAAYNDRDHARVALWNATFGAPET